MGWFNQEEYANFPGEPVRQNLTDPPAGYRIPSPEQPYGISPEKKSGKKAAGDGTTVQPASKVRPAESEQAAAPRGSAAACACLQTRARRRASSTVLSPYRRQAASPCTMLCREALCARGASTSA